jgi:hypothetical protein
MNHHNRSATFLLLAIPVFLLTASTVTPEESPAHGTPDPIPELEVLKRAYPEVGWETQWEAGLKDWKVSVTSEGRTTDLYRADGRYLSVGQLPRATSFRKLIYRFPEATADPSDFTPEEIARIRQFGSTDNRRTAAVSGTALFDAIYETGTRTDVEKHIVAARFLGRRVQVHELIVPRLRAVEAKIRSLAVADPPTAQFLQDLGTADGYSWRQIRDTDGRSFHSMGLAVDLLPRNRNQIIYWNWEKQRVGEDWMLTPLEKRWSPGEAVIAAFEDEGFVWGGRWAVWDNMHFEYRPELILGRTLFTKN